MQSMSTGLLERPTQRGFEHKTTPILTPQAKLKPQPANRKYSGSGTDNSIIVIVSKKDEDAAEINDYLRERGITGQARLFRTDSVDELSQTVKIALQKSSGQIENLGIIDATNNNVNFETLIRTQLEPIFKRHGRDFKNLFLATKEAGAKLLHAVTFIASNLNSWTAHKVEQALTWLEEPVVPGEISTASILTKIKSAAGNLLTRSNKPLPEESIFAPVKELTSDSMKDFFPFVDKVFSILPS